MFLVFPGSKHLLQTNQSILFLGKGFLILRQEFTFGYEGYRMVFTSFWKHASSAFIFASTSSVQLCLDSSEHFRKYRMQVASTFPIAGISLSLKRKLVRHLEVMWLTAPPKRYNRRKPDSIFRYYRGLTNPISLQPINKL